ncbi:MAG: hypothetical protein WBP03_02375 [Candidatus Saccharimonadales bacterium]
MIFGHQTDDAQAADAATGHITTDSAQASSLEALVSEPTPSEPTKVVEPRASVDPPAQPPPLSTLSTDSAADTPKEDDLLSLKQQALEQLTPLVHQLDQTPEERFRTTMMMIQSTDNQALIKNAYEAAQSITDDKVRAQALLDVINEINYFTHQKQK